MFLQTIKTTGTKTAATTATATPATTNNVLATSVLLILTFSDLQDIRLDLKRFK